MEAQGWWSAAEEEELKARLKADVMTAFKHAESQSRCELGELFTDVYGGEEPWNIVSSFSTFQALSLTNCRRSNATS
jgi:2-oxoisovalerate dehydrogenase E1 component alpha subunit